MSFMGDRSQQDLITEHHGASEAAPQVRMDQAHGCNLLETQLAFICSMPPRFKTPSLVVIQLN
jgi:hypothetical protein